MIDPYFDLLGIPPDQWPPTSFQLLGIDPAEVNPEAIRAAAERQLARLQTPASETVTDAWRDGCGYRATGQDREDFAQAVARMATEIAAARDALLDAATRQRSAAAPSQAPNWWQAEVAPAPAPVAPSAPAANWWQEAPGVAPAPPSAPSTSAAPATAASDAPRPPPMPTVVAATNGTLPAPVSAAPPMPASPMAMAAPAAPASAGAPAWWSEEVKPAPKPPAAPATGWWQDSVAESGSPVPMPPPANVPPNPATQSVPTPPAAASPVAAPAWWAGEVKPEPILPPAAPAGGWWKDSAAEAIPPPPSVPVSQPVVVQPVMLQPAPYEAPPLPVAPAPYEAPPLPVAPLPQLSEVTPAAEDEEDDEYAPSGRQRTDSSPLPWILLGLLVIGGAVAGGVWYVNKQNQEQQPAPKEVAAKPGNTDRGNPNTSDALKQSEKMTNPRPKKSVADPVTSEPDVKIGDPEPNKVEQPKKKEADPEPPVKKLDFSEPALYRGHQGMVASIVVSQSARMFLTTSDDKKAMVCSLGDGAYAVVGMLRSEGVGAALCENDRLAVVCDGGAIAVYDLFKKQKKTEFEHTGGGGIRCVAAERDGNFVLAGTTTGYVRWWSIPDNKLLHEFDIDETSQIIALAISSDGSRAVCGLADGQAALLDLLKARAIKSVNGQVKLAALMKAKAIKKWKAHAGRVNAVAFAPDGQQVASFGDDALGRVWNTASGATVAKLTGHQGPILAGGWCADGQRIVSAGIDKKAHLWTAATGKMHDWAPATREKAFSLAVDPQDRFVLVGQSEGIVQLFPLPPRE